MSKWRSIARIMRFALRRSGFPAIVAIALLALLHGASLAQQASPDMPPEKARQFLQLLSDPQVKAWLEGRGSAAQQEPELSISDNLLSLEESTRTRIAALAAAIPRLPEELSRAASIVSHDVNAGRPGLVIAILGVLIAVGSGAEWLVRRGLARAREPAAQLGAGQVILAEAAALSSFALASVCSFLALSWPPLMRRIVLTLLLAIIAFRAVHAAARLLLTLRGSSAAADGAAPPPGNDASRGFWLWRVGLVAGFLFGGWAIASLMPGLGFSPEVAQLAAFLFGLGILTTAIETVWRRPHGRGSLARRLLLTMVLIGLWAAWIAGLLGLLWIGVVALALRPAVRGADAAARALSEKSRRGDAMGVVFDVLIVRGARAAVIAAAVALLAYVWRIRTASLAVSDGIGVLITGLLHGIVILLIADLLWHLSKALIDYRMNLAPADADSADERARSSRLRTLLPIFRNALAVFIATVTVLTVLSGLGVKILPLIAGAGIFGIAIGFGSQTLVKDVLSGVFYMMDDAFRVGEYIQSGSYKGTVESFSLRSVRLRHHRGPVYTVPFGELGAIQNMSRDWVIDKMTIGVTYDSDVEQARKLIKKIGQELAADPEFASDTIEPLKMQGIDSFGDFAVVLRMKLTTKPGAQFTIRRRALMMIKTAFAQNGIRIAYPTVQVEGGAGTAAAAHQAYEAMKSKASPAPASDTP